MGMSLTLPFARKEGWNVPCYPRWARAWTLSVSCYRVVRVEARAPFARGRLAVQRRTPKVPEDFSSGCRGRSLGLGGSVPPYGGIPFGYFPVGLGHDLGRPERLLVRAWAIRRLAPKSSLTLLPWGSYRNLLEAQPSNPWTVTGSVPFIVFLSWFLGARGAPEPPPGARGRSGVS